jgi:DNA-directed RNA polymerase subunit beta'
VIDKALKKKEISKLINASFRRCGLRETVIFADKLMQFGFTSGDSRRHFDLQ